MSPLSTFQPPVAALCALPEPAFDEDPDTWPDYLALGLGEADVPELVRLASDPWRLGAPEQDLPGGTEADLEAADAEWAGPIHAWRALAVLNAEAAVPALVHLVCQAADYENDWIHDDLPYVLEDFGATAIPELLRRLDEANHDDEAYLTWTETIGRIGAGDPAVRDTCVDAMAGQLGQFATNAPMLNAYFVAALVTMGAAGCAPLIEAAYQRGAVDERVVGGWEDVQVALRLKAPDAAYRARLAARERAMREEELGEPAEDGGGVAGLPKVRTAAEKAKAKAKAKAAKASRKKNRKK